jgi:hypothetical protein
MFHNHTRYLRRIRPAKKIAIDTGMQAGAPARGATFFLFAASNFALPLAEIRTLSRELPLGSVAARFT